MKVPAQTNVQLFTELAELGFDGGALTQVRDAYVLAMRLFAGLHRSCGRPFVAHAVGTASVVADAGGSSDLVAAAILHSAYTLGDFGTLRRRIDEPKRAQVRGAAGARAESLVAAYAQLAWDDASIAARAAGPLPGGLERDVLLLRLANEVDEYAGLTALYSVDRERRVARARTVLAGCAALAERLGHDRLAERLRFERDRTLANAGTAALRSTSTPVSGLVPPASYAPRPALVLRRCVDALRHGLRGKAGRRRVR